MSDVTHITVIGAGTMGSGIALTAAMAGIKVCQVDVSQDQLDRARGYHEKTAARNVAKERMTQSQADEMLAGIGYATETCMAGESQFAIEAATENKGLKKKIFASMVETFSNDCILATNTSSISITSIADQVGSAADRVIGMHFFNPVPVMKLVEVIKCPATSQTTLDRTMELGEAMGKTPIAANDHPGFVGPLRLADLIGLDVCRDIMLVLHEGLGHPNKYAPCPKLVELVEAGRLGNKTSWGVYDYRQAAATA